MNIDTFITKAIEEDLIDPEGLIPSGDHATEAIFDDRTEAAYCIMKQNGIVAGVELAERIFNKVDDQLEFKPNCEDGDYREAADILFTVRGNSKSILIAERLVLNFMQRMSGIATITNQFVKKVEGTEVTILDTRKTTPNLRQFEKWAVRIGGGSNHRMGLYDMVMLKDNHVDYSGGIESAIDKVHAYFERNGFKVPIEIETRNIQEVKQAVERGGIQRIMLDNFSAEKAKEAIEYIDKRFETEISGGINLDTVRAYAEAGPDFISVGALTHSAGSIDISLKAVK